MVILPDFAARMAVLDFSQFPADPDEQRALVRFRMKKTVPFDVDAAAVSCLVQPRPEGTKEVDVLATLVSLRFWPSTKPPSGRRVCGRGGSPPRHWRRSNWCR